MFLVLSVVVLGYGWKRLDFDTSDIKNRCHETLTITFFNIPDATLSQQEDMAVESIWIIDMLVKKKQSDKLDNTPPPTA